MKWYEILRLSAPLIFPYFIGFLSGYCISIVLHELGHLVCGRISGYRFVLFRLGKWQWAKDETGKIKPGKGAGLKGTLGQCLMEPAAGEKNFRFILYNAGGSLINIITAAALLIPFFFTDNEILGFFLLGAGLSALMLGLMNLIPFKIGPYPNDGKNISEALKSADAKHGFYVMLKSNAEMSKGKYLSDYDPNAFAAGENADINNFFVANMILMRSGQLEETGAYEQSYRELSRLNPAKLPTFYETQLILSMMFHELVYFRDESYVQCARERMDAKAKNRLFQNLLQMKHPAFLPFLAAKKAFLDGDENNARSLIVQARQLSASLQNPGAEHSTALMLDKLESRLQSTEF